MKKVLLTIALAAFAFAANAQFVVGGQINFVNTTGNTNNVNVTGTTTTEWNVPATNIMTFSLLPKIGYNLSDNMQVGVSFGVEYYTLKMFNNVYGMAYNPVNTDAEDWTTNSGLVFQFAPYFRYNLFELTDNLTLFCEAQLGIAYTPEMKITDHATAVAGMPAVDESYTDNTKILDVALTVTPGLNYRFSDNFSADLYIDLLGIGYAYNRTNVFNDLTVGGVTNTNETTTTQSGFFLTANANAQTLTDHLNLFRLGFNYHF